MKKHSYIGKTKEEAINQAMIELCETRDNLFIKEKEIKSVGLFKSKKIEIEVIEKEEVIQFIKEFLMDITKKMGLSINLEIKRRPDQITYVLYADNNAILIGKNGRTLEALTIITRQAVQTEIDQFFPFTLDVSEYKLKRQKDIERLAKKVAKEVANTKVEVKLDSMNSYERRIVHTVLKDYKDVYTESVGEEPNRAVIIKVKEEKQ